MSRVENPQAFPLTGRTDGSIFERSHEGMTLRDYFAAALAGHIFASGLNAFAVSKITEEDAAKMTAVAAYTLADALLTERAGGAK